MTPKPTQEHYIHGARLRLLIENAHRMIGAKYRRSPLWSLVSYLTGHGSTVSAEICRGVNLNPHQECKTKQLQTLDP